MFKPQCDPMAAMLVGAIDEAGKGLLGAIVPEAKSVEGAASYGSRSVVGDLMGFSGGLQMTPVSHASLGNMSPPDTPNMPNSQAPYAHPSIW